MSESYLETAKVLRERVGLFLNGASVLLILLAAVALALILPCEAWSTDTRDDPFYLSHKSSEDTARFLEVGLLATSRGHTDEFKHGWGGTALADVTHLSPLVFRFSASLTSAKVDPGLLPEMSGTSASFEVSALIRPKSGKLRPYGGGGLTYVTNSAPTDDPPEGYRPDIYPSDSLSSYSYVLGSGFGWQIRAGVLFKLSDIVGLVFDLKWQEVKPSVTFEYTEWPSNRQYKDDVKYDFSALYLSLGVTFAVRVPG